MSLTGIRHNSVPHSANSFLRHFVLHLQKRLRSGKLQYLMKIPCLQMSQDFWTFPYCLTDPCLMIHRRFGIVPYCILFRLMNSFLRNVQCFAKYFLTDLLPSPVIHSLLHWFRSFPMHHSQHYDWHYCRATYLHQCWYFVRLLFHSKCQMTIRVHKNYRNCFRTP